MFRRNSISRGFSFILAFIFTTFSVLPSPVLAQALPQTNALWLPAVGATILPTTTYHPPIIQGINFKKNNPLEFEFLIDHGDQNLSSDQVVSEAEKLVKYFLASLTVPQEEMWVNLSPYEKDRIIADHFGQTEMGREMLAQDYLLKQLTSTLINPEEGVGKEFWDRVTKEAKEKFGTADIPMNTFNKIWIVPETADLYEHANGVVIVDSKMKVMLEEDYVALSHHSAVEENEVDKIETGIDSKIVREVLLPAIEKEVNEGQLFAKLRQVYHSMILAHWYKESLNESLLGRVYVDQKKLGALAQDTSDNQKIYEQYLKAFEVGVHNIIKEEYDPESQQMIPKKYFSGGVDNSSLTVNKKTVISRAIAKLAALTLSAVTFSLSAQDAPDNGGSDVGLQLFEQFKEVREKFLEKPDTSFYQDRVFIDSEGDMVLGSDEWNLYWDVLKNHSDENLSAYAASLNSGGLDQIQVAERFGQFFDESNYTDEQLVDMFNGMISYGKYPVAPYTSSSFFGIHSSALERYHVLAMAFVHKLADHSLRLQSLVNNGYVTTNEEGLQIRHRIELPATYDLQYVYTGWTDNPENAEQFTQSIDFKSSWHNGRQVEQLFDNPQLLPKAYSLPGEDRFAAPVAPDGPGGGIVFGDPQSRKAYLESYANISPEELSKFGENINRIPSNNIFLAEEDIQSLTNNDNLSDIELVMAINQFLSPYWSYEQVVDVPYKPEALERYQIEAAIVVLQLANNDARFKRLVEQGAPLIVDGEILGYQTIAGLPDEYVFLYPTEFTDKRYQYTGVVQLTGDGPIVRSTPFDIYTYYLENPPDPATIQTARERKVGGIDFNPLNMQTNIERSGDGFKIEVSQELIDQFQGVNGFIPIYMHMQNIVPQQLPMILGVSDEPIKEQELSQMNDRSFVVREL